MSSSPLLPCSDSSRRSFLRMAGLTAATLPMMTEGHLAWAAAQQAGKIKSTFPKLPRPTNPTRS